MILSAQSIRFACKIGDMIKPFHERTVSAGMTFGLGPAGYDVRIREHTIVPAGGFVRASVLEHMNLPHDVMAFIADKSSWARQGIAVQNSKAEPGWRGFLTLEISNHSDKMVNIPAGAPMAHVVFLRLDQPTQQPYNGKYQDQPPEPVPAIHEQAKPAASGYRKPEPPPSREVINMQDVD